MAVDLDGTLLRTNSWTHFFRAFALKLFCSFRWLRLASLLHLYLRRRLNKISHHEIKYYTLRSAAYLPESWWRHFARTLTDYVDPEVISLLNEAVEQGRVVVLASAAAGEYAEYFAEQYPQISYCLASPRAPQSLGLYQECRAERKVEAVQNLARQLGADVACVVTDHFHDLPLLTSFSSAQSLLVAPGHQTIELLNRNGYTLRPFEAYQHIYEACKQ